LQSPAESQAESQAQRPDCAVVTPGFAGGGTERVMVALANGLAESGLRVDLVAVSPNGPFRGHVTPEVRIVDLGARRLLGALPGLLRYLRRARPQSLVSAMDYVNVAAVLARRLSRLDAPLVLTVHRHLSATLADSDLWRERRLLAPAMRWAYPQADAVVTLTAAMADDLARRIGLAREAIRVLPNPVVSAATRTRAAEAPAHPWLARKEGPVILGIGRLTRQKRFDLLLDSVARAPLADATRLLILGEGPERARLEAQIVTAGLTGRAALPGFTENPHAALSAADLFVLSSDYEGLPTVLIEAMACGCPVVATDCPTGPAEILESGRLGRLVAPGDAAGLARAIADTLADPPDRAALRARAEAFAVERVVPRYRALLGR